tara:strand:+ start:1187 stop:1390 length:204 start_codon:yes stop_codon:yes gene_type:complete
LGDLIIRKYLYSVIKKWNGKARKGIEPLKKPADLISDSFSPFALSLLGILFSSDTFGIQNLTIFNTK